MIHDYKSIKEFWNKQIDNLHFYINRIIMCGLIAAMFLANNAIAIHTGTTTTEETSHFTLDSIVIQSASLTAEQWSTLQFRAIGKYSNGMELDITGLLDWYSSDGLVATFDNSGPTIPTGSHAADGKFENPGARGLAHILAKGKTSITVGNKRGTYELTSPQTFTVSESENQKEKSEEEAKKDEEDILKELHNIVVKLEDGGYFEDDKTLKKFKVFF